MGIFSSIEDEAKAEIATQNLKQLEVELFNSTIARMKASADIKAFTASVKASEGDEKLRQERLLAQAKAHFDEQNLQVEVLTRHIEVVRTIVNDPSSVEKSLTK